MIIQHDDGRRYAVEPLDFYERPVDAEGRTYERLGFRILHWQDGTAYLREERAAIKAEALTHRAEAEERAAAAAPADEPKKKG